MSEEGYYICDQCKNEKKGEPPIVFGEKEETKAFCGKCCFTSYLSSELSAKWKLRIRVENPRPLVCSQCGKEYKGEKIVFRLGSDVKQFCKLNCFFAFLHQTFDVGIIRDYSLYHETKE